MTRPRRTVRATATTAVLSGLLLIVPLACGGDDDATSTTAAAPSLCEDAQALRSSVEDLGNVDVVENGTSALESALGTISNDAENLITSAGDDFRPETDALRNALAGLRTAIENVTTDGVAPVRTAISDSRQAATDLADTFDDARC